MKNIFIFFSFIALTAIIVIIFLYNNNNLPIYIYHIRNMVFEPKDLHAPILYEDYDVSCKNNTKQFHLKPKYFDIHEIGIVSTNGKIPYNYKFKGKIKFSFLLNGKLLSERISMQNPIIFYSKNDHTKIDSIVLLTTSLPVAKNNSKDDLLVEITVIEEDSNIEKYAGSYKLYAAVSSVP